MSDVDLFGDVPRKPVKGTVPAGYAGLPGTGPAGKTCADCVHARRGKSFAKCWLYRARWTHGTKTDIRLRWNRSEGKSFSILRGPPGTQGDCLLCAKNVATGRLPVMEPFPHKTRWL